MLEALVVLLVVAWAYFVGRLGWTVVGGSWVVIKSIRASRTAMRHELSTMTTNDIRTRLLQDTYFNYKWRAQPGIQQFLSRVSAGDEVALAAEYPRGKLYGMLATAERAAGGQGRPEIVDAIDWLSMSLDELARRTREGAP